MEVMAFKEPSNFLFSLIAHGNSHRATNRSHQESDSGQCTSSTIEFPFSSNRSWKLTSNHESVESGTMYILPDLRNTEADACLQVVTSSTKSACECILVTFFVVQPSHQRIGIGSAPKRLRMYLPSNLNTKSFLSCAILVLGFRHVTHECPNSCTITCKPDPRKEENSLKAMAARIIFTLVSWLFNSPQPQRNPQDSRI